MSNDEPRFWEVTLWDDTVVVEADDAEGALKRALMLRPSWEDGDPYVDEIVGRPYDEFEEDTEVEELEPEEDEDQWFDDEDEVQL